MSMIGRRRWTWWKERDCAARHTELGAPRQFDSSMAGVNHLERGGRSFGRENQPMLAAERPQNPGLQLAGQCHELASNDCAVVVPQLRQGLLADQLEQFAVGAHGARQLSQPL